MFNLFFKNSVADQIRYDHVPNIKISEEESNLLEKSKDLSGKLCAVFDDDKIKLLLDQYVEINNRYIELHKMKDEETIDENELTLVNNTLTPKVDSNQQIESINDKENDLSNVISDNKNSNTSDELSDTTIESNTNIDINTIDIPENEYQYLTQVRKGLNVMLKYHQIIDIKNENHDLKVDERDEALETINNKIDDDITDDISEYTKTNDFKRIRTAFSIWNNGFNNQTLEYTNYKLDQLEELTNKCILRLKRVQYLGLVSFLSGCYFYVRVCYM
jgi:hypothetical protein